MVGANLWANAFCPQQNGYIFLKRSACLFVFIKGERAKRQDNREHQVNGRIVSDCGTGIPESGKSDDASCAKESNLPAGQIFNELGFDFADVFVYGHKTHGSHPLMRVKNGFGERPGLKEREAKKQGIPHCLPYALCYASRRGEGHRLN